MGHLVVRRTSASRRCPLFRDSVQLRSRLVDLVVCVGHHFRGGHRFAIVGERFVGLVADDFTQVGDRGVELGVSFGERGEGETGDGGRRFVASQPVQNDSEFSQFFDSRQITASQRALALFSASFPLSPGRIPVCGSRSR